MEGQAPPKRPFRWWLIWLVLTGGISLPFLVQADAIRAPSIRCTFKAATGVGCPGCGMTRSVYALCRGDFAESIRLHLFGPFAALVLLTLWIHYGLALMKGREPFPLTFPGYLHCLIAVWLLLIVYWVIRLATGTVP